MKKDKQVKMIRRHNEGSEDDEQRIEEQQNGNEQQSIDSEDDDNEDKQSQQNNGKNVENIQQQINNQIDRLKDKLILLYQKRLLIKIINQFQHKLFYTQLSTFHTIKSISSEKSLCVGRQKIIQKLFKVIESLQKSTNMHYDPQDTHCLRVKQCAFDRIKCIQLSRKYTNELKTSFFIKYYINPTYRMLSYAFHQIQSYDQLKLNDLHQSSRSSQYSKSNKSSNYNKSKQHIQYGYRKKQNDERLVKFQKQSKKFRLKSIINTLRNILHKQYLKPTLNSISLYVYLKQIQIKPSISHQLLQVQNHMTQSNNNTMRQNQTHKDARFIKKKHIPHKIIQNSNISSINTPNNSTHHQLLSKLIINHHQVQTISKKSLHFLFLISKIIHKKIIHNYNQVFKNLFIRYFQENAQNHIQVLQQKKIQQNHKTKDSSSNQQQDNQTLIIKNVMKTMCYVSSKITKKRQKKIIAQHKKSSLRILSMSLSKTIKQQITQAFYHIKLQILRQNNLIFQRIKELQEVKRQCLQYFNNSIIDQDTVSQ